MYKRQSLDTPVAYVYEDPMDDANNMVSVTKIGVKWNEGDDLETKLEKIITQKYISLFPYSYEAWSELRRTGSVSYTHLPILVIKKYHYRL